MQGHCFFVAGIGTNIGKTHFIINSCKDDKNYFAIKPIISGFKNNDLNSDSALILNSLQLEINQQNLDMISPWRFELGASPHIASKQEIDFDKVVNFCQNHIKKSLKLNKKLLIESAGGIMTPINKNKTFLDLAQELSLPIILVTANFLGSISQTLCCIEAIKTRKLEIIKIIVNKNPNSQNEDSKISDSDFYNYITNYLIS